MKFKNIFLFSLLLYAISCTVKLTPTYSANAVAQVEQAAAATNNLYDEIISSSDKTFSTYKSDYEAIDTRISDILIADAARPKSKIIIGMANDIRVRFSGYETDHKDAGTLNNSQLLTKKNGMHALWQSLINSEKNFKP